MADAPRGYWKLKDFTDFSGNNLTLSAVGTAPAAVAALLPGDLDGATKFSLPANCYLDGGANALYNLGDVLTIEVWFKRTVASGEANVSQFVGKGNGGYSYRLKNSTNKLEFLKSQTASIVQSVATITDTNVHHAVVTKNGATVHLYLDGVDTTGTVTNAVIGDVASPFRVGVDAQSTDQANLTMDEVAIYPTALTQARIQAHYNTGLIPAVTGVAGARMMTGVG